MLNSEDTAGVLVEIEGYSFLNRLLQRSSQRNAASSGTLVILIISFLFFCCTWAPRIYYRASCLRRRHNERSRLEARVLQLSLGGGLSAERAPHGMSADDRRAFVANILVTKHVVVQDIDGSTLREMEHKNNDLLISPPLASTLNEDADGHDEDIGGIATCTICLTEYCEGEEICWSHNERCNHFFHKECILEWLLRHDECPCCRLNFLSIEDMDEENPLGPPNDINEPEAAAQQGVNTTSLSHSRARSDPIHLEETDVATSWSSAIYVARGSASLHILDESTEECEETTAEAESDLLRDRAPPSHFSNPAEFNEANISVQDTLSDVCLSSSAATSVELEADAEYSASET